MKTLLKTIWEIKNKFKERPINTILRIFIGFLFASGIFLLSYYCGFKFNKYSEGLRLFLPNIYKKGVLWIFNYAFAILFPFTILSSSISIISVFFKDKSLKLYLTLPINDPEFFLKRGIKTFLISNGYIYFLIIPFIFGMSNVYSGFISFLPLTIYLILSFLLSFILTVFLSYFFNVSNLYKLFSFFFAFLTIFILLVFRVSMPKTFISNPYLFFIQFEEPEGFFYNIFRPLSMTFYNLINKGKLSLSFYYLFALILLFFISYLFFKFLYHSAYTKSFSSKEGKEGIKNSKILKKNIFTNLLIKEWLSISRTPLRLTQTALMLSLVFLYFFNFQMVPLKDEPVMLNIYKGLHIFLLSFILSALGLRFCFPSISLEGRSFYIFKTIPLKYKSYFFSKGFAYFLPFFLLSIILNFTAFLNIPFSTKEKILFLIYGLFFSILTSFVAVFFGSIKPQFNNPNPLQIGFSSEGLFYFFICLLISILSTFYYFKDLLNLFI